MTSRSAKAHLQQQTVAPGTIGLPIMFNTVHSQQNAMKNTGTITKIDYEKVQMLLEEYNKASLIYRDEEFTQQADAFLTKISCEKKSIMPLLFEDHINSRSISSSKRD